MTGEFELRESGETAPSHDATTATAGALRLGIEELVARLELELAVTPSPAWPRRVMTLAATEWNLRNDPVGTAAESLRSADALRLEGATTEALPPRWRAALERAMSIEGALADRIAHVGTLPIAALRGRSLRVHRAPSDLPAMVRGLLDMLARHGWDVQTVVASAVPRDTVVRRVRGPSPTAVAETVAALVRESPQVCWVAGDTCLEEVLVARGAPTLGLRRRGRTHLGIVRRVLSLCFVPQHPQDLLDILTASAIPIPQTVVRRLVGALSEYPSWHSSEWIREVSRLQGTSAEVDLALRWIDMAMTPLADETDTVPVDALRARIAALASLCESNASPSTGPLAAVCHAVDALLALVPAEAVTRAAAEGIVRLAESSIEGEVAFAAQAGALAYPTLGAVVGPVAELVVWNAAAAPPDPFAAILPTERRALRAAGVALPDRAARVAARTRDLQRAITETRGRVWLCLPDTDARGEPVDEPPWGPDLDAWLDAPMSDARGESITVPAMRPPAARALWSVAPSLLRARATESPSSAATLLGCSLRHALRHQGRLPEPFAPTLPEGGLLHGRIAHAAFEATWRAVQGVPDPESVAAQARAETERCIEAQAQTLTLPSARGRRLHLTTSVARAAETLARALRAAHGQVEGVEVALGRGMSLAGTRWGGRADIVLGPRPAVLDLKWSGASHRSALAQGTALQLALYAWMLRGDDDLDGDAPWPAAGYLIATTGALHATADLAFLDVDRVRGPSLADTARAAAKALQARVEERARGELLAPGALAAEPRDELHDGALTLTSPCGHCAYTALCGRGGPP